MKSTTKIIKAADRLPPPGRLVEVKSESSGEGWFKARLIKSGRHPLWQCLDFPGTLGAVTEWKETI